MLVENKLIKMIQELGSSFKNFAKSMQNSDIVRILSRCPESADTNIAFAQVSLNQQQYNNFGMTMNNNNNTEECNTNIYKLCETHPRMKDCICAAFPLSQICDENYCPSHPNYYECSPGYCLQNPTDLEACKCKYNPFDTECKCKLNPLRKQCHCLKYPSSVYCIPGYCQNSDNMKEIYCVCLNNQNAPECKPEYCKQNKYDSRCKCLVNPDDKSCVCVTNPNRPECKMGNSQSKSLSNLNLENTEDKNEDFESEVNHNINVADDSESISSSFRKEGDEDTYPTGIKIFSNRNNKISKGLIVGNLKNNNSSNNSYKKQINQKINQKSLYNKNGLFIPSGIRINNSKNQKLNSLTKNLKRNSNDVKEDISSNISQNDSNEDIDDQNSTPEVDCKCADDDTFCICKDHPFYQKCVCLAHPTAEICNSSYCLDQKNKKNYECNPVKNCINQSDLSREECKCKQNFTNECKCKLDPFSRECFCLRYPDSYLCDISICSKDKKSLFCRCADFSTDKECLPNYCAINYKSPECVCIINPFNDYCRCLNNPSDCDGKI
jgi:hypothetical protein